eukprot:scaffold91582_cov54-Phaeocystis_antarctica.AAC.9
MFTTVLPHLNGSGARHMVRTLALGPGLVPVLALEDDDGAWRGARNLPHLPYGEIGVAREGAKHIQGASVAGR